MLTAATVRQWFQPLQTVLVVTCGNREWVNMFQPSRPTLFVLLEQSSGEAPVDGGLDSPFMRWPGRVIAIQIMKFSMLVWK